MSDLWYKQGINIGCAMTGFLIRVNLVMLLSLFILLLTEYDRPL